MSMVFIEKVTLVKCWSIYFLIHIGKCKTYTNTNVFLECQLNSHIMQVLYVGQWHTLLTYGNIGKLIQKPNNLLRLIPQ